MKDNSPQVAQEADQLEQALRAAGLDPDDCRSWPVWNIFTNRGLRPALAAIEQRSTPMSKSFKGVESSDPGGMPRWVSERLAALPAAR